MTNENTETRWEVFVDAADSPIGLLYRRWSSSELLTDIIFTQPEPHRITSRIELDGRRTTLRLPHGFFDFARKRETPAEHPVRTQHLRKRSSRREDPAPSDTSPSLRAPIQATVVRVLAEVGQHLEAGDLVLVLESMKMEKPILAHRAGRITDIRVAPGDSVTSGDLLVLVEPEEETR